MTFNSYRLMKTGGTFLATALCGVLLALSATANGKTRKPADDAKLFQKKLYSKLSSRYLNRCA
jgi:hypothetical protein